MKRRRQRRTLYQQKAIILVVTTFITGFFHYCYADDNSSNLGALSVQSYCAKDTVTVSAVSLTCDSPGDYYYGSSGYRKSLVCMSGDKANLQIEFAVSSEFDGDTIYLSIEAGLYDHYSYVISGADICQFSGIKAYYDYGCPHAGTYTLRTYFTVPPIRDYSFQYTPDLRFLFTDSNARKLGCVTTGTVAMYKSAGDRAQKGLVALGVSISVLLLIFGILLLLSYRRKKRLESLQSAKEGRTVASKYYQYFRTLPNGQVVPLPSNRRIATPIPVSRTEFAISNPSYNETHVLPTQTIL